MPLQVEVKPGETFILGAYVVTSTERTRLVFHDENVPFLREKDIITRKEANTPAKRIYLAIQRAYVTNDDIETSEYPTLTRRLIEIAPSARLYVERINQHLAVGGFYKALKEARLLIEHEWKLLNPDEHGLPLAAA